MTKLLTAALGLATALFMTPVALGDSFTYSFSSSDNSVNLSATFTTDSGAGGIYNITNMTGTFADSNNGITASPISWLSNSDGIGIGGGLYFSPDFLFIYDNLLEPDGTATEFDGSVLDGGLGGVVFEADGYEISFLGTDDGSGGYWANESPDGSDITGVELLGLNSPQAVTPEPSSLLLLATGLLSLGAFARRKFLA